MTNHTPQFGEACTQCGFFHTSTTCPTDPEVCSWHDSQPEETLAALPGYEDGLTPRQAWNTFFCLTPATNTNGESLAARAAGGQGAGTITGGHVMTFDPCPSDIFLWPDGFHCYRSERSVYPELSDDFRVLGFSTCAFDALFDDFCGDGAAYLQDAEK